MSLEEKFNEIAEQVKTLTTQPPDSDLLELYALFKQSTVGDCNTARPGMLDFKGKAKWDSWDGKKGLNKEKAMEQYIAKAQEVMTTYK